MRKILILLLFVITTNVLLAQNSATQYGSCLGLDYVTGSGTYDNNNGGLNGINFYFRYVPPKTKKISVGLSLQQCGGFAPRTFLGFDFTHKLSMKTKFQPYLGLRIGGGSVAEKTVVVSGKTKTEGDSRFIASPMVGVEYFLGGRFSIDLSYKYDIISSTPSAQTHLLFTGLKVYMF